MPKRSHKDIDSYTEEEWTQLREAFREVVRPLTEETGTFTQAELKRRGWGIQLIRELCDEFEAEGRVYRGGGAAGFAWVTDPESFTPKFGSLASMSDQHRERVLKQAEACARSLTADQGYCSQGDLIDQLGLTSSLAEQVAGELTDQGELINVGSPHGYFHPEVDWDPTEDGNRSYGAGISPDSDRFKELYENKFLPLARSLTETNGAFSPSELRTHGFAYRFIDELIDAGLSDDELVELSLLEYSSKSTRRLRSTTAGEVGQSSKRRAITTEELRNLQQRIRGLLKSDGPLLLEQLDEKIPVSKPIIREALQNLREQGIVTDLGHHDGYGVHGNLEDQATLQDLLDDARQAPEPDQPASQGAKPKNPDATLRSLTESQKQDLDTLSTWIERSIADPNRISLTSPLCGWNGDEGEWRLRTRLREEEAYGKILSAAKNLRMFAYAQDLIDWDEESIWPSNYRHYAPEWHDSVNSLTEQAIEANDGKQSKSLRTGVRRLAAVATGRGETPSGVNWEGVRDQLLRAQDQGRLSEHQVQPARRAYTLLQSSGVIDASPWKAPTQRRSLLSRSAVHAAAEDDDWAAWRKIDLWSSASFIDGPYGLSAWHYWSTAPAWKLKTDSDLPERSYASIYQGPRDEDPNELYRAKSSSTLINRFTCINLFLGCLERRAPERVDQASTPADLVDPDLLEELADEIRHRRDDSVLGANQYPTLIDDLIGHLRSLLVFTCLQTERQGDDALQDQTDEAYEYLASYREHVRDNLVHAKDPGAIRAAYRGSDDRAGWLKLADLVDLLLEEAEAEAGGIPIAEQVEALKTRNSGHETGSDLPFDRTATWSHRLRTALLVNILRLAPLRRSEVAGITLDMWKRQGGSAVSGPDGPWAGALELDLPADLMKGSSRPYQAAYISRSEVGDPHHEAGAHRPLLYLWFADGGARETILTDADGKVHESPYLLPADAAHVSTDKNDDLMWSGQSIRKKFSSSVMRHAARLNVNRRQLELLWGATSPHVVRLLYGTYWADDQGQIIAASNRLHHASVETTINKYVAHDPRQRTLEATGNHTESDAEERSLDMPENGGTFREQINRLKKKNRQLQEENTELRQALQVQGGPSKEELEGTVERVLAEKGIVSS